ncbi:hypothetical protein [Pinirhizobacter soli]|uniref:hypothetical protein n=1 Tax=Pinirhizobacter soli TaxID=2786953 RepID=UPI00202A392B|nr:hypothetical protein [Pinirhizobacter soli]
MKENIAGLTLVSGAGSFTEGARTLWHGYWNLFTTEPGGLLTLVERGRTPGDFLGRNEAELAGREAGVAAVELAVSRIAAA